MTPEQRQMIKEAYQEGYYQALDEGLGGVLRFLRSLFKGGDAVGDSMSTAKKLAKKMDKQITKNAKSVLRGDLAPEQVFDSSIEQSLMKAVEIVLNERQKLLGRPFTDDEIMKLLEEFGIGYLFDDFKRFIDPPGVVGKIGFDDLP